MTPDYRHQLRTALFAVDEESLRAEIQRIIEMMDSEIPDAQRRAIDARDRLKRVDASPEFTVEEVAVEAGRVVLTTRDRNALRKAEDLTGWNARLVRP